jgi:hypothetical protein
MRLATKGDKKPQKATKCHRLHRNTSNRSAIHIPHAINNGKEEESDHLKQGDGSVIQGEDTS